MFFQRLSALVIMIIPGLISAYGWNLMKDSYYNFLAEGSFPIPLFIIGLLLFCGGVAFIAGFIFHRDKKRNRVQQRFLKKSR